MIRHRDGDRVDVFAVEELPEVLEFGAIRADHLGTALQMPAIDIADGHIFHAFLTAGITHDRRAATLWAANTDGAHDDFVIGRNRLRLRSLLVIGGQHLAGIPRRQPGRSHGSQRTLQEATS